VGGSFDVDREICWPNPQRAKFVSIALASDSTESWAVVISFACTSERENVIPNLAGFILPPKLDDYTSAYLTGMLTALTGPALL
jgi:hypothetical protein